MFFVELNDLFGWYSQPQPERNDPAGRGADDQIKVIDRRLARVLLQRRQHRRRKRPFDPAAIQTQNAKP